MQIQCLPQNIQNQINDLVQITNENKQYKLILMPIYLRTSDGYIIKRLGVQGSINGHQIKVQDDQITFSENALNDLIIEIKNLINGEVIDGC